jgi:riboflavin biosynthesis pyrimidine reductase
VKSAVAWYELQPGFAANFHITEDGKYFGANKTSRDISNEVDLAHLKKLRSQADAVVIGGSTARSEGYKKSKNFETYVFTRGPNDGELHALHFSCEAELVSHIANLKSIHKRVLSECGPALLNKFLELRAVDQLFLTVTFTGVPTQQSTERIASQVLRLSEYQIEQFEAIENSAVTFWRRA